MLVSTALCSLLGACAGPCCAPNPTTSEIDIGDHRVFNPSVRVSVDIAPRDGSPSEPHTGHAVEADISAARGNYTQTLEREFPVVIDGQTFNAPNELKHEFGFRLYEIDYRYRKFFGRSQTFGIEGLVGLGFAELKVTTSSASQSASEKLSNGGIVLGGGGIWRIRPSTSLQARLMEFESDSSEKVGRADRLELHLVEAVGRHATVRGGWAWWTVVSERQTQDNPSSINSHIEVRFSGPALALEATF